MRSRHHCQTSGWTATKSLNRQFKAFIDAGGYTHRDYWTQPFIKDGHQIAWQDAIAQFRRIGRAGPDRQVGRRQFVSRRGRRTAGGRRQLVRGRGLRRVCWLVLPHLLPLVQSRRAVASFRTSCSSATSAGRDWRRSDIPGARRLRHVRHGRQREGMVSQQHGLPPLLRCAQYPTALPDTLTAPVESSRRDYTKERPANDEAVRIYQSLFPTIAHRSTPPWKRWRTTPHTGIARRSPWMPPMAGARPGLSLPTPQRSAAVPDSPVLPVESGVRHAIERLP